MTGPLGSADKPLVPPAPAPLAGRAGRTRLREFQAQLAERLRLAQTAPAAQNRLGCLIGGTNFLVDLPEAGEILSLPEVTPVPLTRPWYRGLANVRGNLISVVDLSLFAGQGATPLEKDSRVVVFSSGLNFNAGILVTRLLGLRSMTRLTEEKTSADPGSLPAWIGVNLRDTDGVLWTELRLTELTRDESFLQVGIW